MFSVFLLIASVVTTVRRSFADTSERRSHIGRGALAPLLLAIVGTASTLVAWAFLMWAVLLAAGLFRARRHRSPQRRRACWLGGALLAGLAVAIIAVNAKIGPAGEYNDYSDAQDWGMTIACALAAAVRRSSSLATVREAASPRMSAR